MPLQKRLRINAQWYVKLQIELPMKLRADRKDIAVVSAHGVERRQRPIAVTLGRADVAKSAVVEKGGHFYHHLTAAAFPIGAAAFPNDQRDTAARQQRLRPGNDVGLE